MTNTNTLTVDGETVTLTKAQLSSLASRFQKAKNNAKALENVKLTPRSKHTAREVMAHAGDQVKAAKQQIVDATWIILSVSKEIATMKAIGFGNNDKAWGQFIKGTGFASLTDGERSAIMYLGRNYPIAYKAMKIAEKEGIQQIGLYSLTKRTRTLAKSTGATVNKRDTKGKTEGNPKVNGNADPAGNASPETGKGASKAKGHKPKQKPTAETIASDALETAVANGIDPMALLQAITAAVTEAMAA